MISVLRTGDLVVRRYNLGLLTFGVLVCSRQENVKRSNIPCDEWLVLWSGIDGSESYLIWNLADALVKV